MRFCLWLAGNDKLFGLSMEMKRFPWWNQQGCLAGWLALVCWLAGLGAAPAQPAMLVSVNPASGATGVSPSSQVVFSFSVAMDTTTTTARFTNTANASPVPATGSWSVANTVLTCTPTASFPVSSLITWGVVGNGAALQKLSGTTSGSFTTASGVPSTPLVLTNATLSGGSFSFNVLCSTGQTLTVVSTTNVGLPAAQWPALLTTNSPGSRVHISDPRAATNRSLFYRARNGT
jgi:hypothetical protein